MAELIDKDQTNQLFSRLSHWRRHFHANPELSFEEYYTARFIASALEDMGLEPVVGVGQTGVTAIINGVAPGACVALRADMDGLPIQESSMALYRSKIDGISHACGHDGHMAMLLGAAALLTSQRERINGSVKLIFQPAEEIMQGAAAICRDGVLDSPRVDHIFGLHLFPHIPLGTLVVGETITMASADSVEIRIFGKKSHGAQPHNGIDAVYIASQVISALQSVISRKNDPTNPSVLSFGSIHGGRIHNVICDEVNLQGTLRCVDENWRKKAQKEILHIVQGIASSLGGSATVNFAMTCPALKNHLESANILRKAGFLAATKVISPSEPTMGSEDFAVFLRSVPGAFGFLGTGGNIDIHTSQYDFNEEVLPIELTY